MNRYEYKVDHFKYDDFSDIAFTVWLDKRGAEGWHLSHADWNGEGYVFCIFARKLS